MIHNYKDWRKLTESLDDFDINDPDLNDESHLTRDNILKAIEETDLDFTDYPNVFEETSDRLVIAFTHNSPYNGIGDIDFELEFTPNYDDDKLSMGIDSWKFKEAFIAFDHTRPDILWDTDAKTPKSDINSEYYTDPEETSHGKDLLLDDYRVEAYWMGGDINTLSDIKNMVTSNQNLNVSIYIPSETEVVKYTNEWVSASDIIKATSTNY